MAIFFTSDSHFGHTNIIKFCNRPFSSVEEMNREMIEQWNKIVTMYDTVYHLGDFCFSSHAPYFNQLNGNKFLILGNHDKLENAKTAAWKNICDYFELKTKCPNNKKESYILMHYAMRVWNRSHHGSFHLYGHSHSNLESQPWGRSMDVGVDNAYKIFGQFRPFSIDEVREILTPREYMSSHTTKE